MLNYTKLFKTDPFSVPHIKRKKWYFKNQVKLSKFHYKNCSEYQKISNKIFKKINSVRNVSELPFIHANIFKKYNLSSTNLESLSKTLTSSGTSGSISLINLDKKTSLIQSKALNKIFSSVIKTKVKKIFFVDSKNTIKDVNLYTARTAAIKGFSQLAEQKEFLLDKKMNLNLKKLLKFIRKYPKEKFVIFGFTSLIWLKFLNILESKKIKLPPNNGVLIHGGGWKKLENLNISKKKFNLKISKICKIKKIHNYYGMVEQTGSVFLECEYGYFHSSIYSDIFIRNQNLDINPTNSEGLVQVMSLLPLSYPGHNILTEDLGKIMGVDNCKCGRKGKYFLINGRVKGTEVRGCSDTI